MLTATDPLLTPEQRRAVYDQMKALEFHRGPFTPGLQLWALPAAMMFFSAPMFIVLSSTIRGYAALLWFATGMLGLLLAYANMRRNARKNMLELSRLLRERGVRVYLCGRCDYDLRSITTGTCPECGEPVAVKQS